MKVTNPNAGKYQNPYIESNYMMGIRALMFNEYDEAERRFEEVLSYDANHALSYCYLGILYQRKGLIKDAKQRYIKSISLESTIGLAHRNLGLIFGDEGNFDKAIHHLKLATKLEPHDAEAHYHLGLAYIQVRTFIEGKKSLLQAKKITEDQSLKTSVDNLLRQIPA